MEKPIEAIFACSGCHKKFYISGYKINRLGLRNKTCLECAARRPRLRPVVKPKPEVVALSDTEVAEILGAFDLERQCT